MTKSELVEIMCLKIRSLSKTEIEIIVDTMLTRMTQALANGHRIELRGFGSFEVRHRKARSGRNPKTGSTVYVQNRRVPFFKVGKEMRERLNSEVKPAGKKSLKEKTVTLGNVA